jgi:hypothetical protein
LEGSLQEYIWANCCKLRRREEGGEREIREEGDHYKNIFGPTVSLWGRRRRGKGG